MYKNILLTVDLNEESSSKKALPVAVACCGAFGARLHLLTVVPDFGMSIVGQHFPDDFAKKAVAEANRQLAAFAKEHVPESVESRHIVAHGTIYNEILAAAERIGVDLIVMAAHRPGLQDYLLGPNAARVVRHFNGSVMVVRG